MPGLTTHTRRGFLLAAGVTASCGTKPALAPKPKKENPVILLRAGWQWENIGDVAQTPGMLRLLRQYVAGARVILWSNALGHGVERMLRRSFPYIRIVRGDTGPDGVPTEEPLREAFREADFLLHGSGPSVVARRQVEAWRARTGKPYGIFGVTIAAESEAASPGLDAELIDLLNGAAFVYTRETRSLENLKRAGIRATIGFAPDSTFSFRLHNDERAKGFLRRYELGLKQFIAVVPRLRYTPYQKMRKLDWSAEKIARRTAVNKEHAEADHAKLRVVITEWIRQTGLKVLLCPEMAYQVDIIDKLLYHPLPNDVKKNVARRLDYWLPDEASSVYRQAAVVVSFECHSPIIAATNDTAPIYIHQPEDGIKGQMWRDIGLTRSIMEVEQVSGNQIAKRVLEYHEYADSTQAQVHEAVVYARMKQGDGMTALRRALP